MLGLYQWTIAAMFILGVAHMGFVITLPVFDKNLFWFIGTGLALLFCGWINYINFRIRHSMIRNISITVNAILALFSAILAIVFAHIPGFLVCVTSLLLLFYAIKLRTNR